MSYRLHSWQQEDLKEVVNVLEANSPGNAVLGYTWTARWTPIHGCKTSKMRGYKLACRQDTTAGGTLWVGICSCTGTTMHPPPIVKAPFAEEPITSDVIAGLRQAIQEAS